MGLEEKVRNVVVGVVAGLGLAYCAFAYGDEHKRLDLPVDKPEQGRALQPKKPKPEPSPLDEMLPPEEIPVPPPERPSLWGEEIPNEKKSLWYVIDISGSMGFPLDIKKDRETSRLDRAKDVLKLSIRDLPEWMEFGIVAYSDPVEDIDPILGVLYDDDQLVFPGPANTIRDMCTIYFTQPKNFFEPPKMKFGVQLDSGYVGPKVRANKQNKERACSWIDALVAQEWTATGSAVALALTDKSNKTVLVVSDGKPNYPISGQVFRYEPPLASIESWHLERALKENTQGAVIHTFGFEVDAKAESFLQTMAGLTGGFYTKVK